MTKDEKKAAVKAGYTPIMRTTCGAERRVAEAARRVEAVAQLAKAATSAEEKTQARAALSVARGVLEYARGVARPALWLNIEALLRQVDQWLGGAPLPARLNKRLDTISALLANSYINHTKLHATRVKVCLLIDDIEASGVHMPPEVRYKIRLIHVRLSLRVGAAWLGADYK